MNWLRMKILLLTLSLVVVEEVSCQAVLVNKCCERDQMLDASFTRCVAGTDRNHSESDISKENDFWFPSNDGNGGPSPVSLRIKDETGDIVIVREVDRIDVFNQFSFDKEFRTTEYYDILGYNVAQAKNCFESSLNSSTPRVQKVALTLIKLNKCCKVGEEYNWYVEKCEKGPVNYADEELTQEIINSSSISHWLPVSVLKNRMVRVEYNYLEVLKSKRVGSDIGLHYLYIWSNPAEEFGEVDTYGSPYQFTSLRYLTDPNTDPDGLIKLLPLHSRDTQGFSELCFDTIRGEKHRYVQFSAFQTVVKCCPEGEILSDTGHCMLGESIRDQLDFRISSLNRTFGVNKILIQNKYPSLCPHGKYRTETLDSRKLKRIFHSQGRVDKDWNFNCIDWQRFERGARDAMGTCSLSPKVSLYNRVRPLGALTVVLLLVAIGVTLLRKETRNSPHGRALASHAFCLAASNVIQVTWFFTAKPGDDCTYYGVRLINLLPPVVRPLSRPAPAPNAPWRSPGSGSCSEALQLLVIILHTKGWTLRDDIYSSNRCTGIESKGNI